MPRSALALILLIGACLASTACESSSTNVLGPSGTKCGISLPTSVPTIAPAGGPGTLTVTVAPECVWKASSEAAWIAITENANGQGSGVVRFVASGNPTALMRRAAVSVGEARVELSQGGAPCQFTLTPATQTLGLDGGEGTVGVAVIDGCQWAATSTEPWLSVVGTPSGTGTGTVHYRADANTGSTRSGTLKIADRTFVVNQIGTGTPCSVSIGQSEQSVAAAGGDDLVSVSAAANCPWSATSHATWITVTSGASGSGPGAVRLNIAPNAGGQRVGIVTITGNTYAVTQAGAAGTCFYSIAAPGQSAPAAASTGNVGVSASSGCPWTALSQAAWITVASGNAGNGNGVVTLAIATNTGAARAGIVTVAGFSYTVTQDAAGTTACTYAIDVTELTAPPAGTTSAVRVTAPAGCSWTAASQVGWIAVTSGASGSGTATVTMTVAANAGGARTGAVTIAGQTHTVTQQAAAAPPPPPPTPCSYSINSAQLAAPASGATSAVNVTAGAGCGWTATSEVGWITVASGGSGAGNGTVTITVAANAAAARTGIVTIAGQTYTVTQAAGSLPCTYELGANEQTVTALGGPITVPVVASSGCGWTAASQVPWISVVQGATGSGNGPVQLSIAANTGAQRVGTVTIAGQTFTVTQAAAACSYTINPTTQPVSLLGGTFSVEITTQAWCTWTATTEDSWIQITSTATGVGTGTMTYNVPLVSLGLLFSRTGTIAISGRVLTVNQRALLSNER
jgi:hypothetical protein